MKILQVNIFKLSSKNLTSAQMIHLLETLSNLLKSGFTLLESFEFINLYFKYRDKELKIKIIASIKSGETCYEIIKFDRVIQIQYNSNLFFTKNMVI